LSEENIDKIATAVKQKITVDIESIITAKTEPLIFRIISLFTLTSTNCILDGDFTGN
jgi:hypothetical protein